MQPDLIGLEITRGELKRLVGLDPDDVFRPSIMRDKNKRLGFLMNELMVALALTPIVVGPIYLFVVRPLVGSGSLILGIILLLLGPITVVVGRSIWRKMVFSKSVSTLLDEVDKYHNLIKAIYINDQLALSGNTQSNLNDREKIIAALQLIREDLVRALKTERILRDNKQLLADNHELLANNLANLEALQLSDKASDYAQLLNQSFQIALDVQAEIKKLQSHN
ncbi:MAG: hypothetical protein KME64_20080 [Scytonematopsis contorta HA4267-MV1]|nr:hypothetical protein [Scytonematopsis contorta HA4267-MV1]